MKILLIEPRNCWRGLNIALAYLASALKKADIEVKVLDMANHRDWPVEKMEKLFIEEFERLDRHCPFLYRIFSCQGNDNSHKGVYKDTYHSRRAANDD